MKSLTTTAVIKKVKSWFLDFGFAGCVRSDQGPQFRTEFGKFCEKYHIKHETSSPYYPQSNGLAEAAVKNCKYLLLKCKTFEQFQESLLEFRNTPRSNGPSPAKLFFGHQQRTALPRLPTLHTNNKKEEDKITPKFSEGDKIRIQDVKSGLWNIKGVIMGPADSKRSFILEIDEGTIMRRNEKFIKLL